MASTRYWKLLVNDSNLEIYKYLVKNARKKKKQKQKRKNMLARYPYIAKTSKNKT